MLKRFGVSIEDILLRAFDELIEKKGYSNRSEAIRDLIRESLTEEAIKENGIIYGTITFVYDHDEMSVLEKLVEIQHNHRDIILSTTHIHIDDRYCLETLIVKGEAKKIKTLADSIISKRGVKTLKYVFVNPTP